MKASDLRTKSEDELVEQLLHFKREGFNLRFRQATGELENTAERRRVRRGAARIKTIQAERRRAAAKA